MRAWLLLGTVGCGAQSGVAEPSADRGAPTDPVAVPPPRATQPGALPSGACRALRVEPAFGAFGAPITTAPLLEFDAEIPLSRACENLEFRHLDTGVSVPHRLELEGPGRIRVVPEPELSFDSNYVLMLDSIELGGGRACPSVELAFATRTPTFASAAPQPAPARLLTQVGDWLVTGHPSSPELSLYRVSDGVTAWVGNVELAGRPQALVARDGLLYVAAGAAGLLILESTAQGLAAVGQAPLAEGAISVTALGDAAAPLAAVGLASGGAVLLDVSRPAQVHPVGSIPAAPSDPSVTVGTFAPIALASGQDALDHHLVLAEDNAGLRVFDVHDPGAPVLVQQNSQPRTLQVRLLGEKLIVSYAGYPRLNVYDISDVLKPLGGYEVCATACPFQTGAFAALGDRVVLSARQGGLHWLSLSEGGVLSLARPVVDLATTPFDLTLGTGQALGRVIVGDDRGVSVYSAQGTLEQSPQLPTRGDAGGVARHGDYAYVAAGFAGVQVYRLLGDESPQLTSTLLTPGARYSHDLAATATHVLDDLLVVADGRAGVSFYDLAVPSDPHLLASFVDRFDSAGDAVRVRDVVYVCDGNSGLEVFDVGDRTALRRVGELPFERQDSCNALVVDGDRLLLGTLWGLRLLDVSEPLSPRQLHEWVLPHDTTVRDLLQNGHDLWATTYSRSDFGAAPGGLVRRVQRFEWPAVESTAVPTPRWQSSPLGAADQLALAGHTLFVGGGQVLHVFETERQSPGPVLTLPSSAYLRGLLPTANGLYAARGAAGFGRVMTGELPLPLVPRSP